MSPSSPLSLQAELISLCDHKVFWMINILRSWYYYTRLWWFSKLSLLWTLNFSRATETSEESRGWWESKPRGGSTKASALEGGEAEREERNRGSLSPRFCLALTLVKICFNSIHPVIHVGVDFSLLEICDLQNHMQIIGSMR